MNGPIVFKPDDRELEFYIRGELKEPPSWSRLGLQYHDGQEIRCGRTCACEGTECEKKKCSRTRARAKRKCTCEKQTSESCVDTIMKKEEIKYFEEDWKNLWKPQDPIIKDASDDFFLFNSRFGPLKAQIL